MLKRNPFALSGETLKVFWRHAWRYRPQVITIFFGVLAFEALQTYTPILYRDLIDTLTGLTPGGDIKPAVMVVILILATNLARSFTWRFVLFVNNYFQPRVMSDLTNTCYEYLARHSYGFFSSRFVGSLVTKVKRYERSFETIADQITFDLGRSLLDMAIIVGVLIWQYHSLAYPLLGWCAIYLAFVYSYSRFKMPYELQRAETDTRTTAQLADSITNNVNIKLFGGYGSENKRFAKFTDEQFRSRKKSWDLDNWGEVVQSITMISLEFLMIYLAVRLWSRGQITIGDVVLIQTYLLRVFDKLWNAGKNIRVIYGALADANEMTEILRQTHEIQDTPGASKLKVHKGEIEFRGATFGYYANLPVFKAFDFKVHPGERVALIGPSGGGKSTILKLLLRLHDLQHGEILVDGQDISKVTQDSLRAALAFVPQDPILFHRSLFENIRYAKPRATEKEIIRAAKLAHAHEFITSFPQGYQTLVGERGIKLSGGERQRVAIARAILKDAPILVLDEATSSLDSESEMFIQDALRTLMRGRTTIVVAHRLSTIMQMDRIVVIDGGKITEEGKHAELLKAHKGTYQRLWGIQAGGFAEA